MSTPVDAMTASVPYWGAKLAFGESTTVAGHEVIPAALVMFGFGGGGGSGTWRDPNAFLESQDGQGVGHGQGEGSGGGGGGYVLPLGAYVGGPDGLKFRANPVTVIIASVPLLTALGWSIVRIINALK
jgi:uncharacterized spore protein YtfJ